MAMEVNAAASGGHTSHAKPKEAAQRSSHAEGASAAQGVAARHAGGAGEVGGGFLETFRKLPEDRYRTTPTGLKVATLVEGNGKPLTAGMKIRVQYAGWLENGTLFDTSLKHGQPFEVTLGAGRVIKGWEEGLAGMRAGERRQLVIPPQLGYGNRQVNEIPPGSVLIFNVEAVSVDDIAANPKGTMSVVA